jgi:hypothetical protein
MTTSGDASGFVCFADLPALAAFLAEGSLASLVAAGLLRAADHAPLGLYTGLPPADLERVRSCATSHGGSIHAARGGTDVSGAPHV